MSYDIQWSMFALRPEIVCIAIVIFVLAYSIAYRKRSNRIFLMSCAAVLIHLIFDLLTVLTVNDVWKVSKGLNKALHMVFFIAVITFSKLYLDYVAAMVLKNKTRTIIARAGWAVIGAYTLYSPFMNIYYVPNPVTNYTTGNSVVLLFGTAYLFIMASVLLLLIYRKKLEKSTFVFTISTTLFMFICCVLQITIPPFLFGGCGMTVVILGMFFALENPAEYYKQKAFLDLNTGVKNRNSYEYDLEKLKRKYSKDSETVITAVLCDLNGLKYINDNFGHLAGDDVINKTAKLMSSSFSNEYGIYRIGGDEFLAFFVNVDISVIEKQIQTLRNAFDISDKDNDVPYSISVGMCSTSENGVQTIDDIIRMADKRMYANKAEIKSKRHDLGNR